ncbi:unnamed protein product [Acanthoscelides obtectus]|uniref:Uncharacterized protein n=1 Tax=Acanthoscelides obtectus TaxID=200917 RepID=A0A9P0JMA9_ACAOB|nr:unnamed protein product [Acanthoscelides obtectus]CAK1666992.1 hypothetical protein AOBTE_LOCUS25605 [Acanthoscelides obtectus]
MQCTVLVENLNVKQNIKKVVFDDALWQNLQYTKQILHPVSKSINLVESDRSILSEVPFVFKYIKDTILDISQQVDLTSSLIESLLKYVEKLYEFCSKPIHFAAKLLDARFKGEHSNEDQLMEAIEFISEMARSLNLDVGKTFIYDARPVPLLEDTGKDYAVLSVHEDEAEIKSESDAWSEDSNSDSDENIPLSVLLHLGLANSQNKDDPEKILEQLKNSSSVVRLVESQKLLKTAAKQFVDAYRLEPQLPQTQ